MQTKEDPYESKALQNTKRGVLHKTKSIMQDAFVLSPSVISQASHLHA
jgi:hypothetical protein